MPVLGRECTFVLLLALVWRNQRAASDPVYSTVHFRASSELTGYYRAMRHHLREHVPRNVPSASSLPLDAVRKPVTNVAYQHIDCDTCYTIIPCRKQKDEVTDGARGLAIT